MEPFLGELRCVAFNFAPQGWAFCDGQLLPINQNQALFSLLGTTYGGDGVTNFGLPKLQGRVPAHFGQGPALPLVQGQQLGAGSVVLSAAQMPQHTHVVNANPAKGNQPSPIGMYPAKDAAGVTAEYSAAAGGQMNAGMIAAAGGGQAHENYQPTLVLGWIIALQGIFPSRA